MGGTRMKGVWARPLADYVLRELDPLVARQGFGEASLLMRWREIVGARLAEICQPMKLQWPPRAKRRAPEKPQEPATLILRVAPGFGLEAQHLAPVVIERVNAHLGWRCVGKIALRQEELRDDRAPVKAAPLPPDPEARARAEDATRGVANDALRAALVTLGERALRR
jgi:hypothetical protein